MNIHKKVVIIELLMISGMISCCLAGQGSSKSPEYSLFHAAKLGQTSKINRLCLEGVDVDCVNEEEMTPIFIATVNGHYDAVKALCAHGANVNISSKKDFTPLHAACLMGNIKIVKELVSNGAKVDVTTSDGFSVGREQLGFYWWTQWPNKSFVSDAVYTFISEEWRQITGVGGVTICSGSTPLHVAAAVGRFEIVQFLLAKNSRRTLLLNSQDNVGNTALHKASKNGYHKVVSKLVSRQADVNQIDDDGETALHYASRQGHADVIEAMCSNIPAERATELVNFQASHGLVPLHLAALCRSDRKSKKTIEILLSYGAVIDATDDSGKTALHFAAQSDNVQAAGILCSQGANHNKIDDNGYSPLHCAAYHGSVASMVELLCSHGVTINAVNCSNETPLHLAARHSRAEALNALCSLGAEVNVVNDADETPLHIAARNNNTKAVEVLCSHSAEMNVVNHTGETPLHIAASNNNTKVVKVLCCHGAEINAANHYGCTPLHEAVRRGKLNTIEALYSLGADHSITDNRGWTPLHLSIDKDKDEITELLLTKNPHLEIEDYTEGRTPLELAVDNGKFHIAGKLLSRGAKKRTSCQRYAGKHFVRAVKEGNMARLREISNFIGRIDVLCSENPGILHLACNKGHKDIALYLINAGCNVNEVATEGAVNTQRAYLSHEETDGKFIGWMIFFLNCLNHVTRDVNQSVCGTPLHSAVDGKHTDIIHLLVDHGANPLIRDKSGRNAAYKAFIKKVDEQTIILLLDACNLPPLLLACWNTNDELLSEMIEHTTPLDTIYNSQESPLLYATKSNWYIGAQLLLQHGVPVDVEDAGGETPLLLAVINKNLEMVRLFLEYGANPSHSNMNGTSPISYTKNSTDKKIKQIGKILKKYTQKNRCKPS